MAAERLVWVLEDIQGLSPHQFGFRLFFFTADFLLRLEHDISAAFENGEFVLAVFFDLQKANDTTWKLLSLGFCGYLSEICWLIAAFVFELGYPLPVF